VLIFFSKEKLNFNSALHKLSLGAQSRTLVCLTTMRNVYTVQQYNSPNRKKIFAYTCLVWFIVSSCMKHKCRTCNKQ